MIKNLTCHTSGCENNGIAILFEDPAELCICGPCGQQITDIKEVGK